VLWKDAQLLRKDDRVLKPRILFEEHDIVSNFSTTVFSANFIEEVSPRLEK